MKKCTEILSNSKLHDYEFVGLNVNYEKQQVVISLVSPERQAYDILIENVFYVSLEHNENWGKGKYIASSEVKETSSGEVVITILLNSGDTVRIKAK